MKCNTFLPKLSIISLSAVLLVLLASYLDTGSFRVASVQQQLLDLLGIIQKELLVSKININYCGIANIDTEFFNELEDDCGNKISKKGKRTSKETKKQQDKQSMKQRQISNMLSAISRTFSSGNYFASRTHYNSTRLLTLVLPSCLRKQSEEIETTFSTIITSLEDMFQLPANKLIASIKYLTDSELEKDILDKLVSNSPLEPYFGQLADAISHLTVATQCRYTHIECTQQLIFVSDFRCSGREFKDQYARIGQVIILPSFSAEGLYNTIADSLGLLQLIAYAQETNEDVSKLYDRLDNISFLRQIRDRCTYLLTTFTQGVYLHDEEESRVIKDFVTVVTHMKKAREWPQVLREDILHYRRVGRMDTFPSDYKVGVYTPLLALACYPFALLLFYLVAKQF